MKQLQIKFSHEYPKLWKQTKAELIHLRLLHAKELSNELKGYDTLYQAENKVGYYRLPENGMLIQLIFIGNFGIPFCTLRRYTKEKLDHYKKNVGNEFDMVMG